MGVRRGFDGWEWKGWEIGKEEGVGTGGIGRG